MGRAYANAFLFGVTIAIAIGPIALLILRAGLERGTGAGMRCAAGASTADMLLALTAALAGSLIVPRIEAARPLLALTSSVLLVAIGLWLAWHAMRSASQPPSTRSVLQIGYRETFVLTLANPLTLVLFASFVGQLPLTGRWYEAAGLAFAVGLGSFVIAAFIALFGATLGRWITDPRRIVALNIASGLGIMAFGLKGLIMA